MRAVLLIAQLWVAAPPETPAAPSPAPAPAVQWSPELHLSSLGQIDQRLAEPLKGLPKVVVKGKRRPVKSCAELIDVNRHQFRLDPDDNVSWKGFESETAHCFALNALKTAKPAERSYVGWFHLSPERVAKLPPDMTLYFSEDEQQEIANAAKKCQPLGAYDGSLRVHVKNDEAQVSTDAWSGRIVLYARGDLNGDGIEDLLLLRQAQATDGTAADSTLFIVSQTSPRGCLKTIGTLPPTLGGGH